MALNKFMHPRNIYKEKKPNFRDLAVKYPEFQCHTSQESNGKVILNFKDPDALRALSTVLLKEDFGLDVHIPADRLVPTIPLRLNYIHWIEDMLKTTWNDQIKGIDIGTGASCIYPLLGSRMNGWKFLASEQDKMSVASARKNVEQNGLQHLITIHKVGMDSGLKELLDGNGGSYDFCMCNPPFFGSQEEADGQFQRDGRSEPHATPTASATESITWGGEFCFVNRLIEDSLQLRDTVRVYTSMVGKKLNLAALKDELRDYKVPKISSTEFCQGKTMRWGLAWSFDPSFTFPKSHFKEKKKKTKPPLALCIPMETAIEFKTFCIYIIELLEELKINFVQVKQNNWMLILALIVTENTWSHQRRKRRQMLRKSAQFSANTDSLDTATSTEKSGLESPETGTANSAEMSVSETPEIVTANSAEMSVSETPETITANSAEMSISETPETVTANPAEMSISETPETVTANPAEMSISESPETGTANPAEMSVSESPETGLANPVEMSVSESPETVTANPAEMSISETPETGTAKPAEMSVSESPDTGLANPAEMSVSESPDTGLANPVEMSGLDPDLPTSSQSSEKTTCLTDETQELFVTSNNVASSASREKRTVCSEISKRNNNDSRVVPDEVSRKILETSREPKSPNAKQFTSRKHKKDDDNSELTNSGHHPKTARIETTERIDRDTNCMKNPAEEDKPKGSADLLKSSVSFVDLTADSPSPDATEGHLDKTGEETIPYLFKCNLSLRRNNTYILLELAWLEGENRELMQQLLQYFRNKLLP